MFKIINEITLKSNRNNIIIDKIKNSNNNILCDDMSIANKFYNFFINWGKHVEDNILNKEQTKISWENLNNNCHVKQLCFSYNPRWKIYY